MTRRNLPFIIFFNILGIALFLSWFLPANHGYWFTLDSSIFFFLIVIWQPTPLFCIWWPSPITVRLM